MDKHWERPDPVALGVLWGLCAALVLTVLFALGGVSGVERLFEDQARMIEVK